MLANCGSCTGWIIMSNKKKTVIKIGVDKNKKSSTVVIYNTSIEKIDFLIYNHVLPHVRQG